MYKYSLTKTDGEELFGTKLAPLLELSLEFLQVLSGQYDRAVYVREQLNIEIELLHTSMAVQISVVQAPVKYHSHSNQFDFSHIREHSDGF